MSTKYCPGCKCVYTVDMFATANGRKDGLAPQCRKCYANRDAKRIEHGRQRNIKAKLERGFCEVTGTPITIDNLDVFEWDHRDPSQKKYVVGKMTVQTDILYFAEIEKCRLILRSVHIQHTRQQRADGVINDNVRTNNPESVISTPTEQLSLFEEPAR